MKKIKTYLLSLLISFTYLGCNKDKNDTLEETLLNKDLHYGEVSDLDGNIYATIKIGNQNWMAENLRTSHYANGDLIPNVPESNEWINLTSGAWVHYENNPELNALHGKLYNWHAIQNAKGICPKGWHVPSNEEWNTLLNYLGGKEIAGGKLKSKLLNAWAFHFNGQSTESEPNNESGFSSVASGSRSVDGMFGLMSFRATYWSSNEYSASDAYTREIFWNGDAAGSFNEYKKNGYSCRCVQN